MLQRRGRPDAAVKFEDAAVKFEDAAVEFEDAAVEFRGGDAGEACRIVSSTLLRLP